MKVKTRIAIFLATPLLLVACNKQPQEAAKPAAAAPASWRVYVTNETGNTVSVIDGATNKIVETIQVGTRPRGIHASADGKTLYVTLSGSPIAGPGIDEDKLPPPDRSKDGIAVIDVATNKVVKTLTGIVNPEQVTVTEGGKLFAGSEDKAQVEAIDSASGNHLASIPIPGAPEGVAVSPDGKFLYATSEEGEKVYIVDAATNAIVTTLPVGGRPRGVTFSPDGAHAYVTGEVGKSLTAIDAKRNSLLSTVHIAGDPVLPMGVAVSPDSKRVYVSTGRGGNVVVFDATSLATTKTVAVGKRPWGLALSPDGKFLYTANGTSDDVSVLDTVTFQIVTKISTGGRPWGIAVLPAK